MKVQTRDLHLVFSLKTWLYSNLVNIAKKEPLNIRVSLQVAEDLKA